MAKPVVIRIVYAIETIRIGWIVKRRVGRGSLTPLSRHGASILFTVKGAAEQSIDLQRHLDLEAGSRLGITVMVDTVCP